MVRSKTDPASEHVTVRLVVEDIARIDALIEGCSMRWHKGTRSDVIRMLLALALERVAQGHLPPPRPLTPSLAEDDVPLPRDK